MNCPKCGSAFKNIKSNIKYRIDGKEIKVLNVPMLHCTICNSETVAKETRRRLEGLLRNWCLNHKCQEVDYLVMLNDDAAAAAATFIIL